MKYTVKIYQDGNLKASSVKENDYDWKMLESKYDRAIERLENRGYRNLENSSAGYTVLFNEDLMKSTVIHYTMETATDFLDADGKPIILDKPYLGKMDSYPLYEGMTHDRYMFNKNFYDKVYIRNSSRRESHVVKGPYGLSTSNTVRDKVGDEITQQYIDSLELHSEK